MMFVSVRQICLDAKSRDTESMESHAFSGLHN